MSHHNDPAAWLLALMTDARQAKDTELVQWATEIKVRAERKCGELLSAIERAPGNRTDRTSYEPVTKYQKALDENNLNHMAANRMQQLASMPEEHFETAVATAKQQTQHQTRWVFCCLVLALLL